MLFFMLLITLLQLMNQIYYSNTLPTSAVLEQNYDPTDILIPTERIYSVGLPLGENSPLIYRDRHYMIGFTKVNWFEANHICNARNMTLATVNTLEQSFQLREYILSYVSRPGTPRPRENRIPLFWLSGTDLGSLKEWSWFSTGLPIALENWDYKHPNNTHNAACLVLNRNFKWQSHNCTNEYNFICENVCPLDSFSVPIYV